MAVNTGKLTKASFKKETVWGTEVTPDKPLSATSINLINKLETVKDPRNIGQIFSTDQIKVGESPQGSIPVTVHPQEIGPLLDLTLMKNDAAATSSSGYLFIMYTGAQPYAEVQKVTGTISGLAGANHAGVVSAFGFDTTTAGYDTLAELAAAIEAIADWTAWYVGYGATPSSTIADFAYTALSLGGENSANQAHISKCLSASTTTKLHIVRPAGATDTEPSFTVYEDMTLGTNQAIAYRGCKVESFSLKLTSKEVITADMTISAKDEATGKTYPTITIPTDRPFIGSNCRVWMAGTEVTVAKDLTLAIQNGLDKANVLGSQFIVEQIRGDASITLQGSLQLVIANWTAQYSPYFLANKPQEFFIYLQNDWADATNHIYYNVLIRLPAVKLTTYDTPSSGPGRLVTSIAGEAVKDDTLDHIECWVTDTTTGAY